MSNKPIRTSRTEACSCLPPLSCQQNISAGHSSVVKKTYVYRESTRRTQLLSILSLPCSPRTMLRSHYVVLPKRSCGSSTGRGERASVERPFVAGRLQGTVGIGDVKWGKNNERFILFIPFDAC